MLNDRVAPERKRSLGIFYRIAAGIILLAGVAGILYLVFRMPSQSLITEESGKETLKTPPAIVTPPMPDTSFTATAKTEEKREPAKSTKVLADQPVRLEKESDELEITETASEAVTEAITETRAAQAIPEEKK